MQEIGAYGSLLSTEVRSDQTGQTGRTIPVRPVQASAAAGPLKKPTRSTHAHKRTTDAQKSKIQVKSTFVKLKHRICYTCRAKGHMSKDCPNGKVLNSKLVQYNFARLGRDKISTYATKIIQSPNASIRAIWVPKSIVTNVVGSNKSWTPKNAWKSFRYMEMHWRAWFFEVYCAFMSLTKFKE